MLTEGIVHGDTQGDKLLVLRALGGRREDHTQSLSTVILSKLRAGRVRAKALRARRARGCCGQDTILNRPPCLLLTLCSLRFCKHDLLQLMQLLWAQGPELLLDMLPILKRAWVEGLAALSVPAHATAVPPELEVLVFLGLAISCDSFSFGLGGSFRRSQFVRHLPGRLSVTGVSVTVIRAFGKDFHSSTSSTLSAVDDSVNASARTLARLAVK